jgi:hypothetical protein
MSVTALDYKKIKSAFLRKKLMDPRKIFTTLKRDTSKFKRPSDEQGGWKPSRFHGRSGRCRVARRRRRSIAFTA